MLLHYIIAIAAFVIMFVLFLVISKTMNSIINHLSKLEYLLLKEKDFVKHELRVRQTIQDQIDSENRKQEERDAFDEENGS
ncbi:MAG: hypothetical protein GF350_02790 [Chitinivibrionales bacterium]|nr:hypothetical protein [Chitinivibrionales bacterium]